MAGKIFINYRRGDDPSAAQALLGRLEQTFSPEQLFMDVDNIEPGLDFVRVLNDQVAQCDVLISIIGKNWLDARDEHGDRRLDNPDDFVRIEIETALQQDKRVIPVLVGQAQMPRPDDLPDALRPLARRNAVRLTHERFRSDVLGLIKSLQEGLKEIEARREAETEAKRRAQAEAERAFNVAKRAGTIFALNAFLAAYGTSGFAEEAQALRAVLLAREAAFRDATARDDPADLRGFIATYLKGSDVDHARRRLRRLEAHHGWRRSAGLIIPVALALVFAGGAGAYWFAMNRQPSGNRNVPTAVTEPALPSKQTVVSRAPDQAAWDLLKETTDAAAFKHFVAEYPTSPLRRQAEARLAALETAQPAKPASPRPDELAWQLVKDATDEAELKRFVAQYPDSPLRKEAEARIAALEAARVAKPPPPRPDEIAWAFLKGTTDEDALKRFIAQYPNSALRKDAEAQLAALDAVQTAWNNVKDSNDPDQLRQFVEQYPNSVQRADAEQRIASLSAPPSASATPSAQKAEKLASRPSPTSPAVTTAAPVLNPTDVVQLLKIHLRQIGCDPGDIAGDWDAAARHALGEFNKYANTHLDPNTPSLATLEALQKKTGRICPLLCGRGTRREDDQCVAITCSQGFVIGANGKCEGKKKRATGSPRSKPSSGRIIMGSSEFLRLRSGCIGGNLGACRTLCNAGGTGACNKLAGGGGFHRGYRRALNNGRAFVR